MALNIDKNFTPILDATTPSRSFKIPVSRPAEFGQTQYDISDREAAKQEEIFIRREKRGFLDIDLNALPQDDSPAAKNDVDNQEFRPAAAGSISMTEKISCKSKSGNVEGVLDDKNREERERRDRRWKALLFVTEVALREYEENLRKQTENGRKNGVAEETVAPPVVTSQRGRAVTLPNKYVDSFLEPSVAVAKFPRRKRSRGAAATNGNSR